jgi:uncharacterized membrane protein
MQPTPEQISRLKREIDVLSSQQNTLQQRIQLLSDSIRQFEKAAHEEKSSFKIHTEEADIKTAEADAKIMESVPVRAPVENQIPFDYTLRSQSQKPGVFEKIKNDVPSDFEKFIGENLISKIGIVILVIGVGIGSKYAIDKDLLSPLARIMIGYLIGAGILGFGLKFKEKYENFSAILVSGAMAIFYLITFAAYSFYQLIPQGLTFGLMVVFTAFTVAASHLYNRQWIALLALVGGYGVPFLLSNNTGRVEILFSYMLLLNAGILAVAVKKYWQTLYYTAFGLTWMIMLAWLLDDYREETHFKLAMLFSTLFFLLFYAVFLVNKLVEKKPFGPVDVILVLLNSFIYFGIGFSLINEHATAERFGGLFTLLNAIVHFAVAATIFRMKLADKNLFFLIAGMVLVFITIAVPVQFDGGWVTLTWASEAALLFWIGRTQQVNFYEQLSYPLMVIALFSQVHDWSGFSIYGPHLELIIKPILNKGFLLAAMVCLAFGFITFISVRHVPKGENKPVTFGQKLQYFAGNILPPAALLILLFFTFRHELIHFWEIRYDKPLANENEYFNYYENGPTKQLLSVWMLNYSLLFVAALGFINLRWLKSTILSGAFLVMGLLLMISLLLNGLPQLGNLRDSAMNPDRTMAGVTLTTAITLRYITIICAALLLLAKYLIIKSRYASHSLLNNSFDILLHLVIINVISYELVTWLKINAYPQFDKLGLSICWGIYSLFLIGFGIYQQKQHVRLAAIVLFGVTLVKLFFYDLTHLTTIAKTIVFIALGILLLVISFLYNKYKTTIAEKHEE